MKRINCFFAVSAILVMGFAACNKDNEGNDTPQPTPEDTMPAYAFVYQGRTLAAGDTIFYYPTAEEAADSIDQAAVFFYIKNLTDAAQQTRMNVTMQEGTLAMGTYIEVCFGSSCTGGPNPWTSDPFNVAPGLNSDLPITFDYHPSLVTERTTFKVTVGQGTNLARSQSMYINVAAAPLK